MALAFVAVLLVVAALVWRRRGAAKPPPSSRIPGAPSSIPTLSIPVRDVGSPPQRFVDLRSVPAHLLVRRSLTDVLSTILAPHPDPASVVWVLPPGSAGISDAAAKRIEATGMAVAVVWPMVVVAEGRGARAFSGAELLATVE